MPLYDSMSGKHIPPEKTESYEIVEALRRSLPKRTFNRVTATVRDAVLTQKPSQKSALVWVNTASLFGHGSMQPAKHIDHLWDKLTQIVGPELNRLAVGSLLRWQISLIEEDTWLVYTVRTGEKDPSTGKEITRSEYWINNAYKTVSKTSLNKLADSWGARIHEK